MNRAPHLLSIAEAGSALRAGTIRSTDLVRHALDRIARFDPNLHAFITVTGDRAYGDAERADRDFEAGVDRGPLQGIPYALKDIFLTAGIRTTCNSRLLADHVPNRDSAVHEKLQAGGAVLIGKLGTHEFALGGPGFDLPFPPSRNPWNPEHFTGGSSSGAGAAVAAGFVRLAIGSDTGGSIRSPACLCGVVGLKPTFGRVSRRGGYPLSYSLDHVGPLGRCVADAAQTMNVIAGHDPSDPASADYPVPDFTAQIGWGLEGVRIGYARHYFAEVEGVSEEMIAGLDEAAALLAKLGAVVEEVELPEMELFKACGRILMTAEAFAIHEGALRATPRKFGRYMYQRVAPGALLSAEDVIQAARLRRELTQAVNRDLLSRFDAMVTSAALRDAVGLDRFPEDWPPPAEAVAVQTVPFNVTGNPALSLPIGLSRAGLPLGIQIAGRMFDEAGLFRIAAALEAELGIVGMWPDLRSRSAPVEALRSSETVA